MGLDFSVDDEATCRFIFLALEYCYFLLAVHTYVGGDFTLVSSFLFF